MKKVIHILMDEGERIKSKHYKISINLKIHFLVQQTDGKAPRLDHRAQHLEKMETSGH